MFWWNECTCYLISNVMNRILKFRSILGFNFVPVYFFQCFIKIQATNIDRIVLKPVNSSLSFNRYQLMLNLFHYCPTHLSYYFKVNPRQYIITSINVSICVSKGKDFFNITTIITFKNKIHSNSLISSVFQCWNFQLSWMT